MGLFSPITDPCSRRQGLAIGKREMMAAGQHNTAYSADEEIDEQRTSGQGSRSLSLLVSVLLLPTAGRSCLAHSVLVVSPNDGNLVVLWETDQVRMGLHSKKSIGRILKLESDLLVVGFTSPLVRLPVNTAR